jgi:hypothetical protein
LTRQ